MDGSPTISTGTLPENGEFPRNLLFHQLQIQAAWEHPGHASFLLHLDVSKVAYARATHVGIRLTAVVREEETI